MIKTNYANNYKEVKNDNYNSNNINKNMNNKNLISADLSPFR